MTNQDAYLEQSSTFNPGGNAQTRAYLKALLEYLNIGDCKLTLSVYSGLSKPTVFLSGNPSGKVKIEVGLVLKNNHYVLFVEERLYDLGQYLAKPTMTGFTELQRKYLVKEYKGFLLRVWGKLPKYDKEGFLTKETKHMNTSNSCLTLCIAIGVYYQLLCTNRCEYLSDKFAAMSVAEKKGKKEKNGKKANGLKGVQKNCPRCTLYNPILKTNCIICKSPFKALPSPKKRAPPPPYKKCPKCTFHNRNNLKYCTICNHILLKEECD